MMIDMAICVCMLVAWLHAPVHVIWSVFSADTGSKFIYFLYELMYLCSWNPNNSMNVCAMNLDVNG